MTQRVWNNIERKRRLFSTARRAQTLLLLFISLFLPLDDITKGPSWLYSFSLSSTLWFFVSFAPIFYKKSKHKKKEVYIKDGGTERTIVSLSLSPFYILLLKLGKLAAVQYTEWVRESHMVYGQRRSGTSGCTLPNYTNPPFTSWYINVFFHRQKKGNNNTSSSSPALWTTLYSVRDFCVSLI